jgi:hypothetical protein
MEFTLNVRVCRSITVNDQWRNARENEIAIYFTAPTLRNWDRKYDFSDFKSTDDFYICSYTKYKIMNTVCSFVVGKNKPCNS